ncbi:ATP-grasp domain-containing protein [Sphingobacterium sp. ML3W]|uniref:ATP-grasp domain-containing protein n=1 Tax=Sphingobacterium sp. ML3W TaxID=1538644 RepID=UPI00249C9064|nr:ATP-grasp domain-containing protein [Sphingobacterium sp. ML3W]WFA80944.1 ATP-grasp domain-containing protein [Sphingobacterium sp. ML3W]
MKEAIAIIYQTETPPKRNGIIKPMKPGGYSDSGADIAYSLQQQNIRVITPVENPKIENDLDWVFPDTIAGIQSAIGKGANIIWLNTVLYKGHPIEDFIKNGISVVGQIPENVDLYDDKWITNDLLKASGLPIPKSVIITHENVDSYQLGFPFPVVTKPIRGRGSQGVSVVNHKEELTALLKQMFGSKSYGEALYVEEFLSGQEITITVMPRGKYIFNGITEAKNDYWALPPIKRFNHHNGIAPYNGTVAVINNSKVLTDEELRQTAIIQLCRQCEQAAKLVNAKAPIRIDCRANADGKYFLFDLNMKPNMTGASRPHRQDQDSLTALAARKIGWSFDDLILNMLHQHWKE